MNADDELFMTLLAHSFLAVFAIIAVLAIACLAYWVVDRYFLSYRPRSDGDIYAVQDGGPDRAARLRTEKPIDFALRRSMFMATLTDEQRAVFRQHAEKPGVTTMADLLVSLESSEDPSARDIAARIRLAAGESDY